MRQRHWVAQAAGLGLASGLRAFTPLAVVGLARARRAIGVRLALQAAGEWAYDASPGAAPRTAPPAFGVRVIAGAVVGGAAARAGRGPLGVGAAIGAIAAGVGALLGLRLRLAAARRFGAIPAALGEDLVALGLAAGAAR